MRNSWNTRTNISRMLMCHAFSDEFLTCNSKLNEFSHILKYSKHFDSVSKFPPPTTVSLIAQAAKAKLNNFTKIISNIYHSLTLNLLKLNT